MSGLLRRLFVGDPGQPPPPDLAHQPSIPGQSIVEILYSDSAHQRAVITCDAANLYRIHIQFWDTSDWQAGYGARWYGDGGSSFTDSIERARALAREALAEVPERTV